MTPLQENVACSVTQDTELVTIDSSPIQLAYLPKPRVTKRKDDRFMLRYSPVSPTLGVRNRPGLQISNNQAAKSNRGYATINGMYNLLLSSVPRLITLFYLSVVSELEVEPLQVHHTLWGKNVPLGKAICITQRDVVHANRSRRQCYSPGP